MANAMWAANPAQNIVCSIRPMEYDSNANVTRPDGILFMTVTTTITQGAKSITFSQSFDLPQPLAEITLLNRNIHHAYTYIGTDPMAITYQKFMEEIVESLGYDTPCAIRPPRYDEVQATQRMKSDSNLCNDFTSAM